MNDKKNIDRLFQEKFKDFEISPNEIVWEKIKASQKKEKKRVFLLPFWYRAAGIAALIVIIFSLGNSLNNIPKQNTIVINTDTQKIPEQQTQNNDRKTPVKKTITNITVASEEKEVKNFDKKPEKNNFDNKKSTQNLPLGSSNPIKNKVNSTNKNKIAEHKTTTETNTTLSKQKTTKNPIVVNYPNQEIISEKEKYPVFVEPDEKNNTLSTKNIVTNNKSISEPKESTPAEENFNNQDNKKSIFDVINKESEEEIATKNSSIKKWNISPNIAPVYYNSIGNGSPIDSQFADNNKEGEVNMSYGIQVSYIINKKLSVRSGVNKLDLSYNTTDIGFVPSAIGQNLQSVNYNSSTTAIFIADLGNNPRNISESLDINRNAVDQTQNIGFLNQSIAYIEVPMEMKYALVDKKIGVNMIGGISTLFLQKNKISIEAGDFETPIGEANNLNEVSFSGNIGLGVDYKLSEHLEVNLEPIFKYQLNAFNETANNFKPYYFGVYTGVNIKF
ncbi:hypothetical protein [Aquimarina muelleri]|uniref:Outer membrane protein beta-barrel domain-containing protein n=1 Tax=Aquimarina muelleri TaxID=279356 RepID=A0A918JXI8_9FLAO|nr:hypothetical protein [Aquimarina muelleri]MCX2763734.1 porin family protein [Aquimarina muelleri]GGX29878.1 hypothetical protein GCM10007384_33810 [Aquimarina muelleri]